MIAAACGGRCRQPAHVGVVVPQLTWRSSARLSKILDLNPWGMALLLLVLGCPTNSTASLLPPFC
jgi:hypothetical protein